MAKNVCVHCVYQRVSIDLVWYFNAQNQVLPYVVKSKIDDENNEQEQ